MRVFAACLLLAVVVSSVPVSQRPHASFEGEIPIPEGFSDIATVLGNPTWEHLFFNFDGGLAIVNTEGETEWACPNLGFSKHLLPNGHVVSVVQEDNVLNSPVEIRADCEVVKMAEYGANGHEVSFDHLNGGSEVILLALHGCDGNIETEGDWRCENVISWDLTTNTVSSVINLGDYYEPSTHWGLLSEQTDWLHANAAGVGNANNIVVGIRHLSAVVSFDRDTREIQWTLSSEIESDFAFLSEEDKFYNAHGVHQLENGNIMMYDNGNVRDYPEKVHMLTGHSRGLEYELDFQTMTVKVVFDFPTAYSAAKGKIYRLDNGNTLVACPQCDSTNPERTCSTCERTFSESSPAQLEGVLHVGSEWKEWEGVVYEVDPNHKIISELRVNPFDDGLYRVSAVDSLPTM